VSTRAIAGSRRPIGVDVNEVAAALSKLLVAVARSHANEKARFGDESIAFEIYSEAFNIFLKQKSLVSSKP
jgi:hypothetical protein